MTRCAPCKLNERGSKENLCVNNPGSISCKAVFSVENYVKRCWLTTEFKIIDLCKLNREQVCTYAEPGTCGWATCGQNKNGEIGTVKLQVKSNRLPLTDRRKLFLSVFVRLFSLAIWRFFFVCLFVFLFFFFYGYLRALTFHNFYCNIKLGASNKIISRLIVDISICSALRSGLFHLVENVFFFWFHLKMEDRTRSHPTLGQLIYTFKLQFPPQT